MKQPFGNLRPTRRSFSAPSAGWACLLLPFLAVSLHAADLPAPITLGLPIPTNLATPVWLGHPDIPDTAFAALNLPILTPDTNASLLVTVYFQEKQSGFLRVVWKGTQGAELLSDNLYENIGMANQRSLLISPTTLVGDGILTFQCGDTTLGVQKIKLEWLANTNALVSPAVQGVLVTPSSGSTQPAQSLNGQVAPTPAAAWDGEVVTVPLTDQALRIEQGVEFSVDLDKVPVSARLALEETGLPLGQHLVVWINGKRAGTITPPVPDLLDEGFLTATTTSTTLTSYVGWRDASFYVPVSLLTAGVNAVQFSAEDEPSLTMGNAGASAGGDTPPLAIKSLVIQLNYQPVTTPADSSPTSSETNAP